MKKVVFVFLAMIALCIPLLSTGAVASVTEIVDYDTGIKAEAPEDRVRLEWTFECCYASFVYGVAEISYRHTSPKNAAPGGFDNPVQGGYWENGYWYGWVEFDSWISGKKGTNHGDIEFSYSNGYPCDISWSFNVRHS